MKKPVIRCSELDPLLFCGASRVLKPLVAPRSGGEGDEGSMIHWELASRFVRELGAWEPAGGLPPPTVKPGYKLPKMSEWIVGYGFNLVKHAITPSHTLEVEAPFAYEFDRFILSGHIDLSCVTTDALESSDFDWKTGYKPVSPAACNSQALGYLVLKKRAYPTLQRAKFTIAQPRNSEEDGFERVTSTEVEGSKLEDCVTYLEEQVNAALDKHDELNSGMTQCAWCPVGIQCPAIQAEIKNMRMTLTSEMLARITREPNDALLGDMIISARMCSRAIEDAETLLHARLDNAPVVVSGNGVHITRTEQGGSYDVINPCAMLAGLQETVSRDRLALALNYPVGRIKDAIAEELNIPKTGKAAMTAESVFQGKFGPHVEQRKKRMLHFSAP